MRETLALTRKEIASYFSSALALVFIGVFLLGTLAIFFYADDFWARGLADMRPFFRSLPVLLIFLTAALSMRQWSEEEAAGTLELLLILPVRTVNLVLAKFLGVMTLVAITLALTLFLPLSVAFNGDLDPGPVVGGYVAALLMAAMYTAIGLFVSSRVSNQLVALFMTAAVGGAFYVIGLPDAINTVGSIFDTNSFDEIMRALGSGSRFDSIERGVLDVRDLAYYVSFAVAFLALNVVSLDSRRWGRGSATAGYRLNMSAGAVLLVVNALLVNVWLFPITDWRADLTEEGLYTLSDVTKDTVSDLPEPLTIRAYLSEDMIPELEAIDQQLRDTLQEYEIAGDGNVEVEFIDPIDDDEAQQEAANVYGIRPFPTEFRQGTDEVIRNIYFAILVLYGDQSATLSVVDMIEVDQIGDDFEIRFSNLEYDLTSTIRTVVSSFQNARSVLATLDEPVRMTLYYSGNSLTETYSEGIVNVATVASELEGDNLIYAAIDVDDPANSTVTDELLSQNINPRIDFLSGLQFYFHLVLDVEGQRLLVEPTGDTSEAYYRNVVESVITRLDDNFLPTVGLWTPPLPQQQQLQPGSALPVYQSLQRQLDRTYDVQTVDLTTGFVSPEIDVLFLINPQNLTDIERYAIDQYVMSGRTLLLSTSTYQFAINDFGGPTLQVIAGQVDDLLENWGITQDTTVLMDLRSLPGALTDQFGFVVEQYELPNMIDVRADTISQETLMTRNIDALTVPAASPLNLDLPEGLSAERLFWTTDEAWASFNSTLGPSEGGLPFNIDGPQDTFTLATLITGTFDSFYAEENLPEGVTFTPRTTSPSDTNVILIGSSEFFSDIPVQFVLDYRLEFALQFAQNVVDWALEDPELLEIRTRSGSTRLLDPLEQEQQGEWIAVNMIVALVALLIIAGLWRVFRRGEPPMALDTDIWLGFDNDDDDDDDD